MIVVGLVPLSLSLSLTLATHLVITRVAGTLAGLVVSAVVAALGPRDLVDAAAPRPLPAQADVMRRGQTAPPALLDVEAYRLSRARSRSKIRRRMAMVEA